MLPKAQQCACENPKPNGLCIYLKLITLNLTREKGCELETRQITSRINNDCLYKKKYC